jgi:hypothetical protein
MRSAPIRVRDKLSNFVGALFYHYYNYDLWKDENDRSHRWSVFQTRFEPGGKKARRRSPAAAKSNYLL